MDYFEQNIETTNLGTKKVRSFCKTTKIRATITT
jgi:hypothetical protein